MKKARRKLLKALKQLVRHCCIHSGYTSCGYLQMTTEQKALYDWINGRGRPNFYDRLDDGQRLCYDKVTQRCAKVWPVEPAE